MRLLLAIIATLLILPSVLLFLFTAIGIDFYTKASPGGDAAMGSALLMFILLIAAAALFLASILCAIKGGFSWIGPGGFIGVLAGLGVTAGVALAGLGVYVAWMERMGSWVVPVGVLTGLLAPIALAVFLLVCLWGPPASNNGLSALRVLGLSLGVVALGGYVGLGYSLAREMKRSIANAAQQAEIDAKKQAEKDRRDALTPLERLKEDYAKISPTTPFWWLVSSLPDDKDPEIRAFVVARTLQVPDLENEIRCTIISKHPRYRHGSIEFLIEAPAGTLRPEHAAPIAESARISAQQIAKKPTWLHPDSFSNPDPARHLGALAALASRLPADPDLAAAIAELRAAVAAAPAGEDRDRALAAIDAASVTSTPEP